MPQPGDFLSLEDELNLYLVTHGQKPAAMLFIYAKGELAEKKTEAWLWITKERIQFRKDVVSSFHKVLDNAGVSHYGQLRTYGKTYFWAGIIPVKKETSEYYDICIGKDKKSLEKLVTAKTDHEKGMALGYPEAAVHAFCCVIDGERRDGNYFYVSLAKAKQAGIELPAWLAYLSFVPENMDLIGGNVSPTSEALGKEYQAFVRKNNPSLAEQVEQKFSATLLPQKWTLRSDGHYKYVK